MMIVRSRTSSSSYYYLNYYYWQFLRLLLICWMLAMYHWIRLPIGAALGGHRHHRLTTMTIMTPRTHREDIARQGSEMWKVMVAVCIATEYEAAHPHCSRSHWYYHHQCAGGFRTRRYCCWDSGRSTGMSTQNNYSFRLLLMSLYSNGSAASPSLYACRPVCSSRQKTGARGYSPRAPFPDGA